MVYLLFKQIMSMMIMIACGFTLVKTGILDAKQSGTLSSITIYKAKQQSTTSIGATAPLWSKAIASQ